MDEETYEMLKIFAYGLICLFIGVFMSLIIVSGTSAVPIQVNATDSLGNNYTFTVDLPELNNTYYIINITNQTFIYNQTVNATIVYNVTNITCINCTYSYNITNISYVNQTNISNFYNGTQFDSGNYYNKKEVDDKTSGLDAKFNDYYLKADYKDWRITDTFLIIGIVFTLLISLFCAYVIIKSSQG